MTHVLGQSRGDELLLWDVHRLWRLAEELPVERVSLEVFQSVLENRRYRFWAQEEQVPPHLEIASYARRISDVDLAYPIILSAEGELMDGLHRLTKAWMLGVEMIRVGRFPVTPEPDERRPL
jgi:hypothetical protein